jgi:adenosine deaminase CECR1
MMKGLFNYKTAYVQYIREFLAECARENIQYAEIRPNFMQTNQVWEDDGSKQLNNEDVLKLIISGYEDSLSTPRKTLMGLKVIYCTPRSFDKPLVAAALKECLAFKKKYPAYIAGKGQPLSPQTTE